MNRLADYVEKVCADQGIKDTHRPFNNGAAQNPPTLRPNGVNRILLYPGSFNPPHKGHLDLLTHVFHNAGHDLHLTAATILLTDDEMLAQKTSAEANPLVLEREKRVTLWRNSGGLEDWAWVYPGSQDSWKTFRQQLTTTMERNGKQLKFIILGGPDWIGAQSLHDPEFWGCVDAITSDVSRPVDFRYQTTLRQLSGCTPWTGVTFDRCQIERQIMAKLRVKDRNKKEVQSAVDAAVTTLMQVATCRTYSKPKGAIRFVPCNIRFRPANPPSSTKIRQLIATCSKEKMREELERMALSPKVLLQYVRERTANKSI